MSNKNKAISILFGMLAALMIVVPSLNALSSSPDITKISRQSAAPDLATSHVVVVPAASFSSDGYSPFDDTFFWFGGGYIQGDTNNYGCVKSAVKLPDKAIVFDFYVSLYDNSAADDLLVSLHRVNRSGVAQEMAVVQSAGTSTFLQNLDDWTIDYPVVDRPEYAYYATVCVSTPEERLYSVRVWYNSNRLYLPIVNK